MKTNFSTLVSIMFFVKVLSFIPFISNAQLKVSSDGSVGIGTSPTSKLHCVTTATSGNGFYLDANTITTGYGLAMPANGITSGAALSITSTSTMGAATNSSKMFNITRSGTNAYTSHTAYGLYSSVTNTGPNSTNVSGYFNAEGAINNWSAIFNKGDVAILYGKVGIGTSFPASNLEIIGSSPTQSIRDASGTLRFGTSSGTNFIQSATNTETNSKADLRFSSMNGITTWMIIKGVTGTVGINTVNPGAFNFDIYGTAHVTGNIWSTSDLRLKKNIRPIDEALEKILRMSGKSYEFKIDDSKEQNYSKGTNLGLIAQELIEVLPEAVYLDTISGFYSINYIAIIPVMVEALKEQQNSITAQSIKIKELTACLSALENNPLLNPTGSLKNSKVTTDLPVTDNTTNAFLYQNAPNPFTVSTVIKYYLPESISNSNLFIYDMQGSQIKCIPIQQRGNASITIAGSEFKAGMYIYTLVADGKEVDTKRMILTD